MKVWYWGSWAAVAVAALSAVWIVVDPAPIGPVLVVLASAGLPVAVLLAVAGRLDLSPKSGAVIGGATIGVGIALVSHAAVFAFAYFFFLGFADAAVGALDALRIDPAFTAVLGSPWVLLALIQLAVVAPITEEFGKAVGASLARPQSRREAFMAGVSAGVGFAVVENLAYATAGLVAFYPWEPVVLGRMLGAAVHPLASGLVVMAWWEMRNAADRKGATRRLVAGIGVHSAWNSSLVVAAVAGVAYETSGFAGDYAVLSLAYSGAIGVLTAAALWLVVAAVASGKTMSRLELTDSRVLASWTVLASTLLVPVAILVNAFPEFLAGG
jgi:RsiW-degrading membrane proteinase PrsW (M82 family)